MTQTLDWRTQARCRLNPDLFTTNKAAKVHAALHICRSHCPVREQCHADAQELPIFLRHEVVLGGVSYGNSGRPTTRQKAAETCTACRMQTRRSTARRREDEGPGMDVEREMDEERAADEEAARAWAEERP